MKAKAGTGGGFDVDFQGFNEHLFDVIGSRTRTLGYVVCGLVELGTQELDPFEIPLAEASADHKKALDDPKREAKVIIAQHPKTKEPVETLSIPQKPKAQMAIVVEIPKLKIDYGKFFSKDKESDVKPYRFYMGGEWMVNGPDGKKIKILGRPSNVVCGPNDKAPSGWAYASNNLLFKFAEAAGLTDENNILDQDFDLGELLGSQGAIKVSAKKTEKNDKVYVNVTVKDPSPRAEEVPPINLEKEGIEPWGVMLNDEEVDPDVVKKLSAACKNSIKRASEYEGSFIQSLLEGSTSSDKSEGKQSPSSEEKTASAAPEKTSEASKDEEEAPWEADDLDDLVSEESVEESSEVVEDDDEEFDPFA